MCYFYSYNASDTSTHINKQQFDKSSSDKDHLMVKALSMKELLHHRNTTVLCLAVLPPQTKGTQRTAWLGHSHGHDWHTFRLPQLWQNPCCVWETSWFPRLWQSLVCVCVCVMSLPGRLPYQHYINHLYNGCVLAYCSQHNWLCGLQFISRYYI